MEGDIPSPRDSHTATKISQNELLVVGGRTDDCDKLTSLNDIYLFNLDTFLWSEIILEENLKSRYGHSASFHSLNKCVYLFGGIHIINNDDGPSIKKKWLNNIYSLNVESYKLTKIDRSARWEEPRCYHTSSIVKNKLYLIGGYNKLFNCLYTPAYISVFDLGMSWYRLVSINTNLGIDKNSWYIPRVIGAVPSGRWKHHSVVVNSEVVVYGGYIGTNVVSSNALYILDTG